MAAVKKVRSANITQAVDVVWVGLLGQFLWIASNKVQLFKLAWMQQVNTDTMQPVNLLNSPLRKGFQI